MPLRLTKSLYLAGQQCLKRLWWEAHEPNATELIPDVGTQWRLEQGKVVERRARELVPEGQYQKVVKVGNAYARIDILETLVLGQVLIEVKSATKVRPEHVQDVAFQCHLAWAGGHPVTRMELMHLNPEARFPDLSQLFIREDLGPKVSAIGPAVSESVRTQLRVLDGPLPQVPIGEHCLSPRECPFLSRCWAARPEHHIGTLHRITARQEWDFEKQGIRTIQDLPERAAKTAIQVRQRAAVLHHAVMVESGLAAALEAVRPPIAFLDFETVQTAIPEFAGCGPWEQLPAQFSVQRLGPDRSLTTHHWLAGGGGDPRPALAEALVEACAGAESVVVYSSSFEAGCLARIGEAVPTHADRLEGIRRRLVDLLPVVRDNVYHPDFRGSFSLKQVVPALVPELSYSGLAIQDGDEASFNLARIVFQSETMGLDQKGRIRENLRRYCELDTLAMVHLLDTLRTLATERGRSS